MVTNDLIYQLSTRLDNRAGRLRTHSLYYAGAQPLAFLAPADREALKDRIVTLPVNYCRLIVDVLADRLRIEGFTSGQGDDVDLALWRLWKRAGMVEGSDQVTRAALIYGRCPVSVWSTIKAEDPRQCVVATDPATGERLHALKRWHDLTDGFGYGVLYLPDRLLRLRTSQGVPAGGVLPSSGWNVVETLDNPFGVVPVVDILNRPAVGELHGVSELADIEPLVDAITKLASDMMVSAEFGARPRRFTLGVEIQTDPETGEPVNPFVDGPSRVWQLEGDRATAQIGQLEPSGLGPYSEAIATLTHQIAALSQMPPSMVGISMNQPASAEALRASESGLAARARARQRAMTGPWAEIAQLAGQGEAGFPRPDLVDVEPVWSDPETPTVAQAADAATKLVAAGILSVDGALDSLGYSPEQIAAERIRRRQGVLDGQGIDLTAFTGPAAA